MVWKGEEMRDTLKSGYYWYRLDIRDPWKIIKIYGRYIFFMGEFSSLTQGEIPQTAEFKGPIEEPK